MDDDLMVVLWLLHIVCIYEPFKILLQFRYSKKTISRFRKMCSKEVLIASNGILYIECV